MPESHEIYLVFEHWPNEAPMVVGAFNDEDEAIAAAGTRSSVYCWYTVTRLSVNDRLNRRYNECLEDVWSNQHD